MYRFAQIVHDSKTKAVPVLFTWPSRGELLAYTYDRESANFSRDALELVLREMVKDPAVDIVYIATPHALHRDHTLLCLKHKKAEFDGQRPLSHLRHAEIAGKAL